MTERGMSAAPLTRVAQDSARVHDALHTLLHAADEVAAAAHQLSVSRAALSAQACGADAPHNFAFHGCPQVVGSVARTSSAQLDLRFERVHALLRRAESGDDASSEVDAADVALAACFSTLREFSSDVASKGCGPTESGANTEPPASASERIG